MALYRVTVSEAGSDVCIHQTWPNPCPNRDTQSWVLRPTSRQRLGIPKEEMPQPLGSPCSVTVQRGSAFSCFPVCVCCPILVLGTTRWSSISRSKKRKFIWVSLYRRWALTRAVLFYKYWFFYFIGYKGSEVCVLFTQHWVLQEHLLPTVQVQKSAEFKTSLKTELSSECLLLRDSRDQMQHCHSSHLPLKAGLL